MQFACSKPKPDMTRHWVPILPEHVWSKIAPKSPKGYMNNPPYLGSGPYTCVEWKKNNYVHLVASPNWWGPKPKITDIYFTYYTNGDTMLQDIKAGTVDAAENLVPAQVKQLQGTPGIEARAIATDAFDELAFNCYTGPSKGNPVLRDGKFRRRSTARSTATARQRGGDRLHHPRHDHRPAELSHDPDSRWEPPEGVVHLRSGDGGQLLAAAGYKDKTATGSGSTSGSPSSCA